MAALVQLLESGSVAAAAALAEVATVARPALETLRAAAHSADSGMSLYAARGVWRIEHDPGPLLERAHRKLTDVVRFVEELGQAGWPLLPALRAEMERSDDWRRVRAASALWRITGEFDEALPILLDAAGPRPVGRVALEALGQIGTPAAAIEPQLHSWLADDLRYRGLVSSVNDLIEQDEVFQALCRTLLRALHPGHQLSP